MKKILRFLVFFLVVIPTLAMAGGMQVTSHRFRADATGTVSPFNFHALGNITTNGNETVGGYVRATGVVSGASMGAGTTNPQAQLEVANDVLIGNLGDSSATNLTVVGFTKLFNHIVFGTTGGGTTPTANQFEVGTDGSTKMRLNVPTNASFNFSYNGSDIVTFRGTGVAGLFNGILQSTSHLQFTGGAAIVPDVYEVGRDVAGTNNTYINVPTGAGIDLRVNAIKQFGVTATETSISQGLRINVTETATSYTVLLTDNIIGVTSTASARTITLPSAVTAGIGKVFTIKDQSGGAASHNITIASSGGNIDGASTYAINSDYKSIDVYSNGTNWFVR